ncbi:MAG: glycosyltransferase [Syntrophobacteraceae bacterium]
MSASGAERPINLLFLFVTMPVGGAETLCLEVLNGLDRTRFNPMVCCIARKGVLGEQIEKSGFEVIELQRMRSKRFDPMAVSDLVHLMGRRRIDILHANMYHANLYGRLAAIGMRARRPRVIAAIHSLYTERKQYRLLVNRILNRYTDRILTVSGAARDDILRYEKVSSRQVIVLPPGRSLRHLNVSMTREQAKERVGLAGSDFVVGTVGRLVAAKGHRFLLEAIAILSSRGIGVKLVMAGGGPLETALRAQAAELGIEERVLLLGTRGDVPELLRGMDVFVMSSVSEAAPVALVEAMAAGLPCVVTTAGGMVAMVDHGRCGVLAPPGDSRALADALSGLVHHEARRTELGDAAARWAGMQYSSEAMVAKLESIYSSLIVGS